MTGSRFSTKGIAQPVSLIGYNGMIVNIDHLAKIVPPGAVEAEDNFVPISSKDAALCKVNGIAGSKTLLPSVVIIECGNGVKICMTAFMILSSFVGIVQI